MEAEIDLLHDTLGDDTHPNGKAHDFKASSFPVAKLCYVCQQKIWGMGKVGLTCRVGPRQISSYLGFRPHTDLIARCRIAGRIYIVNAS